MRLARRCRYPVFVIRPSPRVSKASCGPKVEAPSGNLARPARLPRRLIILLPRGFPKGGDCGLHDPVEQQRDPRPCLHIIGWTSPFEPTLGTDLGGRFFPIATWRRIFAFALYATLHGVRPGPCEGSSSRTRVGRSSTSGAPAMTITSIPKSRSAATPIGAAIAALAVVPTLRKARRRLAAPWSPVIYRPLGGGPSLCSRSSAMWGSGKPRSGRRRRMASEEPVSTSRAARKTRVARFYCRSCPVRASGAPSIASSRVGPHADCSARCHAGRHG